MAAPLKISRLALQAAAKAAGFQDLRKVSLSQFRALCAAAGANGEVIPSGTGAAGAGVGAAIGAPGAAVGAAGLGTKGSGGGISTASLSADGGHGIGAPTVSKVTGAQGAAAAGLGPQGTGIGANSAGTCNSVPRAAGLTGGMRVGAKDVPALGANDAGLVAAGSGGISFRAPAAGGHGHGRGGAASAMFGIRHRAGLSTSAKATAPGCVECAKIKALCMEMEDSFHKRMGHIQMHYRLSNEVAMMKREAAYRGLQDLVHENAHRDHGHGSCNPVHHGPFLRALRATCLAVGDHRRGGSPSRSAQT